MNTSHETFAGYRLRRETWRLGGRQIDMTWPADMDSILDSPTTHERFAKNEYMPYWAQPWPASVLLAEHILAGEAGAGRTAVDLGCGVGLISVAAALAGWSVCAADHDADALRFAEMNAERNNVRLQSTILVDFIEQTAPRSFDQIFGSDILYERRLAGPVARWVASGLSSGGCALISDPNRSAADDFPRALAEHGLAAQPIEATTTAPAGLLTRGRIWSVFWQSNSAGTR